MEHLSLGPETALELLLSLLRAAAYFFAGFALLALFTYVVLLCMEIFSPRPPVKAKTTEVPQKVGCASVVEQNHDLVLGKALNLAEALPITAEEVLQEELNLEVFAHDRTDQRSSARQVSGDSGDGQTEVNPYRSKGKVAQGKSSAR